MINLPWIQRGLMKLIQRKIQTMDDICLERAVYLPYLIHSFMFCSGEVTLLTILDLHHLSDDITAVKTYYIYITALDTFLFVWGFFIVKK